MQSARANVGGPPSGAGVVARSSGGPFAALSAALDREATLGYVLVAPVIIILVALVAYPLAYAIQLSFMDKTIGTEGKFVGLQTILGLWESNLYRQTLRNTIVFTAGATVMAAAKQRIESCRKRTKPRRWSGRIAIKLHGSAPAARNTQLDPGNCECPLPSRSP